jgi:hypothetical protein
MFGVPMDLAGLNHLLGCFSEATLVFEKAGTVSVDYDVRAMGSEGGHTMPGMKGH